jgi:hypothetical protein
VASLQTLTPSTSNSGDAYLVPLLSLGPDLSGRGLGETVRDEILRLGTEAIVMDCTGIDSMSPSFADEAFGRLVTAPGRPRIRVINASPDILSTVRFAVNQRTQREPKNEQVRPGR